MVATAAESGEALKSELSQTSKMIELTQVQDQVHAQSVQKVGEIANKNPRKTIFHHPLMGARERRRSG